MHYLLRIVTRWGRFRLIAYNPHALTKVVGFLDVPPDWDGWMFVFGGLGFCWFRGEGV